ncbi:MAG: mannose-1-phosphate guanylyltransferase/mannose-6-phosphate isomerase, partial [Calditrichaeota bacterium]|nr:mannose-1-phosphate guanylyltransferase/mannose-6-phosphate isomerase [Calditrichota bacterium]
PSDHIIASEEQFRKSIDRAQLLAEQGFLVTLGIKPEYPETGYGYIQAGKKLVEKEFEVKAFIEKPDFEKAKKLYEDKAFYWNSGIFIWKVSTIIDEFKSYKPQLHDSVKKYLDSGGEKYFAEIENISIDHAILEQSDKVAVVEADLKWSDLGSWRSVYDIQKKDNNGNVLNGNAINIESKNTFVQNTTDYRTVAVVGVNNVSVIDTDDAVIICDLNRTQDVKRVVDQLKDEKSEKLDHHRTVYRPWGYYKILEDLDHFKTKRLVIYPGQSISLQYHKKRNETWTIVSGTASVIRGEEQLELNVGETVYIPAGYNHRVTNNSKIDVELIEVQTGTYFGEDDIIRIDDQYNRI